MLEPNSIEPAVGTEIENNENPSMDAANEMTTLLNDGVTELVHKKGKKNKNKPAKDEKNRKKKKFKEPEDYFKFNLRKAELAASDDEYLEGEDLEKEIALYKKMRAQVVKEMEIHRKTPFVNELMNNFETDMTPQEFKESELQIYAACLPHPDPL